MKVICAVLLLGILVAPCLGGKDEFVINEGFEDLDDWSRHTFADIEEFTAYRVKAGKTNSFLVAVSDDSASGLIHTNSFDIYRYPVIEWRWKVDNVYSNGNALRKSGDDFPLRVYVMFEYDPEDAGWFTSAKYELAKKARGEYPPHSSLNYIWANRAHEKSIIPSPYTGRSKMVVQQSGSAKAGTWLTERVNALQDYRAAFGEDPPDTAAIAVMNDSDNTGEASTSYLDFISVRATPLEGAQGLH
jgi:hypothetical protein